MRKWGWWEQGGDEGLIHVDFIGSCVEMSVNSLVFFPCFDGKYVMAGREERVEPQRRGLGFFSSYSFFFLFFLLIF